MPSNFPLWCAYYDSLGVEGILSAAATMNNNSNVDVTSDIPTACPSDFMIAVTNTTRNDIRNTASSSGLTTIDLGAPGTSILSTNPSNAYGTSTGTSMATPHVAGSVGLMYAAAHPSLIALAKTNPDSIALLFKQIMLANVDTLTGIGLDSTVSKGRLNLYKTSLAVNTLTGVTVNNSINPETFVLKQNYPNPFNPSTKIEFSIPVKGLTSLKIYDITGKEVASLVNGVLRPGLYTADFNAGNLSSGIYFYSLKSESGFTQTKKMMLIK